MAEWDRNKVEQSNINDGKEFTSNDVLTVAELNAMVNNSFYAVDFVEAMADAPDISDIDGDGTPNVSLVNNGKFKRFKFSNLKGDKGDRGDKGDKGDKGDSIIVDSELSATSTNPVQNAVITKTIGDISSLLDYINGESV